MLKVKEFLETWNLDESMNKWFDENPNIEIRDIKYSTHQKVLPRGYEDVVQSCALVMYTETDK